MLYGNILEPENIEQVLLSSEKIYHLILQTQTPFTDKHSHCHAGDTFTHRIAGMPHAGRIGFKPAFTDDLVVPHDHNLVDIHVFMERQILEESRQMR